MVKFKNSKNLDPVHGHNCVEIQKFFVNWYQKHNYIQEEYFERYSWFTDWMIMNFCEKKFSEKLVTKFGPFHKFQEQAKEMMTSHQMGL